MTNLRGVVKAIKASRWVMVCSHRDPDGDSIGSQLAVASLLGDLGKKVAIVNHDPVPDRYKFLDIQGLIQSRLPAEFRPDTAIVLDCSSLSRLGMVGGFITPNMTVVTIDHHPCLSKPDDPAYFDPLASSTGELIVDLFKDLEIPIGRERATQLYTAILTDTGGFRFPNTSAKCLAAAAELAAQGIEPSVIAQQVYEQLSESSLKLLSLALGKMETLEDNRICLVCLEKRDLEACQAVSEEAQGVVDHLLSLKDCLVGILLREALPETVKVSLRTRQPLKANKIAEALGGGGHPNAAGYRTQGPLSRAREEVVREIKKWL
jgi:phosphoesterase RecJ-like protein